MPDLEKLHIFHLSLFAFCSIACKSLHELVLHYIKQNNRYIPDYDERDCEEASFSKFLKCLRTNHEDLFNILHLNNYPQISRTIFTNDTKQNLNAKIRFRKLNITVISNILENTPYFPCCKSKHRRKLNCKSNSHIGKCCLPCDTKHICRTCRRTKCKGICCLGNRICDHPCSNTGCPVKLSDCNDNSTVCCKSCGVCISCELKEKIMNNCTDREIRKVINVIICLRNLVAHHNEELWEKLDNGTFSSAEFPFCQNWDDLSKSVFTNISKLLSFLEIEKAISTEEYENRKYDLNKALMAKKEELLNKFRNEILMESIMIEQTKVSFNLQFELELLNKKLPRSSLEVTGEVMTTICEVTKQIILHETSAPSDYAIEVIEDTCQLVYPNNNLQTLKVKLIIEPKDLEAEKGLLSFKRSKSEASKELWDLISGKIKQDLKDELGIDIEIWREQWKVGSLIIKFAVLKKVKSSWKEEEIEVVRSIINNVMVADPNLNVNISINSTRNEHKQPKIKFGFLVNGVSSVSMDTIEVIKVSASQILDKNTIDSVDITQGSSYEKKGKEIECVIEEATPSASAVNKTSSIRNIGYSPNTVNELDKLKSRIKVTAAVETKEDKTSIDLKDILKLGTKSKGNIEEASSSRRQHVYAVTARSVPSQCGGYDENFIDEVSADFYCVVCKLVFRDPQQLPCGHLICFTCLETLKHSTTSNPKCPIDREGIDPNKVFPDAKESRRIMDLRVICSKDHCKWIGELRALKSHQKECRRTVIRDSKIINIHNRETQTPVMEKEDRGTQTLLSLHGEQSIVQHVVNIKKIKLAQNIKRRRLCVKLYRLFISMYLCAMVVVLAYFTYSYWSTTCNNRLAYINILWICLPAFILSSLLCICSLVQSRKFLFFVRGLILYALLFLITGSYFVFSNDDERCRTKELSNILIVFWATLPLTMQCLAEIWLSWYSLEKYNCICERLYREPRETDLEAAISKYEQEIKIVLNLDNDETMDI